jgi:Ser/Thr protein kinase RdoA (MazF antagonist)
MQPCRDVFIQVQKNNFYKIMNKTGAIKLLKQYSIGDVASITKFINGLNGSTYLIVTENKKYVLKIQPRKNKGSDIIQYIDFLNYLRKNNFSTNKLIRNKDGKFLTSSNASIGMLMDYIDGTTMPWQQITNANAKKLATIISSLYKLSIKHTKEQKIADKFSDKHFTKIGKVIDHNIPKKADLAKIRTSIIHSDISRDNIILSNGKIKSIIDFGDLHIDYLIWDYATLLTQVFVTKTYGIDWNALKTFHHKFSKNFKWNKDELATIIPLMIYRNKMLHNELFKKYAPSRKNTSIMKSVKHKEQLIRENAEKLIMVLN